MMKLSEPKLDLLQSRSTIDGYCRFDPLCLRATTITIGTAVDHCLSTEVREIGLAIYLK